MRTTSSNVTAYRTTQFSRAFDRLLGAPRALALAAVLLLPVSLMAQAGGGGGGGAGGTGGGAAGAGAAGAGGAAGSSSAGGSASGSERPAVTPAAPAPQPSPTEPPPAGHQAAAEEGPTGMPAGWWEDWTAAKKQLRDDIGLDLNFYSEYTARYETMGPEAGVFRNIIRYDIVADEHFTEDSLLSLQVRGGWGKGLDPIIGTFANTDQYANAGDPIFILHLYYQHKLLDKQLTLQVGKFDIGDWLDTNRYGYYNFLGYVMAHNTTIPLTGNTLGAMATWEPKDQGWYISGGAVNATQSPQESGFQYLTGEDASWFSMAELGFKPKIGGRDGVYRFIGWESGKEFTNVAGDRYNTSYGGAISFDQDITDQLGVFVRYGVPSGNPFEPKHYYQGGFLIKEPIPGRKKDTLAFGVAVNQFSNNYTDTVANSTDTETYYELYYNLQLFPWLQIQPVLQVVDNPGGLDRDTSLIGGVHLHFAF